MAWLHAVYFLDQNHGWVAGSKGTLLETTDGGQTWTRVHPPTEDNLRDVYFANDHDGWLVCERDVFKLKTNDEPRSYLLKSSDGGLSWTRINLGGADPNAHSLRATFTDSERGWAFGEGGAVLVTRDGGANWSRQILPTKYLLLGGVFIDERRGWLVGAGGTILQTNDGGTTWRNSIVRNGTGARFTSASFVGNYLGWTAGTSGRVFATTDGGRTWFEQRSNVSDDLLDIKFIDADEGWIAGAGGTLLHTSDGGAHWNIVSSGTTHRLERLFFVGRDRGWAVGFGGAIIAYGSAPSEQAPRLRE